MGKKYKLNLNNPKAFCDDLWRKIVDERLFSYQKNDICDYLLYLFNKHDSAHFLDSNTNEQNERLLKMNASKIKSSKKNIAIKFMDSDEYDKIFGDFLDRLAISVENKTIRIDDDSVKLVIENPALRDILASKLKVITDDTLDFSLNSEKVSISSKNFLAMLHNEVSQENLAQYYSTIKSLESKYKKEKVKSVASEILKVGANVASIINLIKQREVA